MSSTVNSNSPFNFLNNKKVNVCDDCFNRRAKCAWLCHPVTCHFCANGADSNFEFIRNSNKSIQSVVVVHQVVKFMHHSSYRKKLTHATRIHVDILEFYQILMHFAFWIFRLLENQPISATWIIDSTFCTSLSARFCLFYKFIWLLHWLMTQNLLI